jgi:hypothetical protein
MTGEGRTTGDESISPNYMAGSGMFVSKDDVTQQIAEPYVARMGEGRSSDRHRFTPGLPLSPSATTQTAPVSGDAGSPPAAFWSWSARVRDSSRTEVPCTSALAPGGRTL